MMDTNKELLGFGLANLSGKIFLSSFGKKHNRLPNLRTNSATADSFHQAMQSKHMVLGRSYYLAAVQDWVIPLRYALRDKSGKLLGVMTSGFKLESNKSLWSKSKLPSHLDLVIYRKDLYAQYITSVPNHKKESIYSTKLTSAQFDNFKTAIKDQSGNNLSQMMTSNKHIILKNLDIFEKSVMSVFSYGPIYQHYMFISVEFSYLFMQFKKALWWIGIILSLFNIILYITFRSAISNITKREKERDQARINAENANKAKGKFLSVMSHELRTPMNGVLGMAQLLRMDDLTAAQLESCDIIITSGSKLVDILDDILEVSKIEAGREIVNIKTFDLAQAIKQIYSLFMGAATAKKIKFTWKINPKIQQMIKGDDELLRRILTNLVANAIKFTNEGHVGISVDLLNQSSNGQTLCFRIIDSGIGISKENQKQIFQPFLQANDSISTQFGGTGLGLSIVKDLVELMGGVIFLESDIGSGSAFSFNLVFETETQPKISDDVSIDNNVTTSIKKTKALVIEDDVINQKVIKEMLLKLSITEVDIASNGKEGIEYSLNNKYDLIFMDLLMPKMNGHTATRVIRSSLENLNYATPIMAITAMSAKHDKEKCFEIGMQEFLTKPLDFDTLKEAVHRYRKV